MPGKRERGEAIGALRQLARDTYVQPQLWQRVQQLEGDAVPPADLAPAADSDDDDAAVADVEGGAGARALPPAVLVPPAKDSSTAVYDYPTVSMALKVRLSRRPTG